MLLERNHFISLVFITFVGPRSSIQKRGLYVELNTCNISSSDPHLCDANCTITKVHSYDAITAYVNVLETAEKGGLSVHFAVKPLLSNGPYLTMGNRTIPNLCTYLRRNNRSNLVEIAIDEVLKFGKVPTCPIAKDSYYIKNFYISPIYLPPYTPEAKFKMMGALHGTVKGKFHECARISITGSIMMSKNAFWNHMTSTKATI